MTEVLCPFGGERQVWSGNLERWAVHYCGLFPDLGGDSRYDQTFPQFLRETFLQTAFVLMDDGRFLAHLANYPTNEYTLRRKVDLECYNHYANVPPSDALELGLCMTNTGSPVINLLWPPGVLRLWADYQEALVQRA